MGKKDGIRTHKLLQDKWVKTLEKQGFVCQVEKTLGKGNDKLRVDVYAENDERIVIVEVVDSSWTGKHPSDYLETDKEIQFIVSHPVPVEPDTISKIVNGRKTRQKVKQRRRMRLISIRLSEETLIKLDCYIAGKALQGETLIRTQLIRDIISKELKTPDNTEKIKAFRLDYAEKYALILQKYM